MDVPFFGDCLREARDRAGLSSVDAATAADMHPDNFSRLMNCRRGANGPAWTTIFRLIVSNDMDLSAFFPDDVVLGSANAIRARQRREQSRQSARQTQRKLIKK